MTERFVIYSKRDDKPVIRTNSEATAAYYQSILGGRILDRGNLSHDDSRQKD